MKKRLLFLILLLPLLCLPVLAAEGEEAASPFPLDGLPIISITSARPLSDVTFDAEVSSSGTLTAYTAEGEERFTVGMESFHRRGVTSDYRQAEKKPYSLKLTLKADLIDGAGRSAKWCLLTGDMYDEYCGWVYENPTLMQLYAFTLYRELGGAGALDMEPVSLYYNGEYRGVYLLTEAARTGKSRGLPLRETVYRQKGSYTAGEFVRHGDRNVFIQYYTDTVLADPGGGFLIEMSNAPREPAYFVTSRGYYYNIREPKAPTREQLLQIALYVEDCENAMWADSGFNSEGRYFTEYLDLDALIVRMAVDQFTANCDAGKKSVYWFIDTDETGAFSTKLTAGPAWDYDGCNLNHRNLAMADCTLPWLKHGELVQALYDISCGPLRELTESYAAEGGKVEQWIELLTVPEERSYERWGRGACFNGDENARLSAVSFVKDLAARRSFWYDTLWAGDRIFGVTAAWDSENGAVSVSVSGSDNYELEYREVGPDGALSKEAVTEFLSGHTYEAKVTALSGIAVSWRDAVDTASETYGHRVGVVQFSNPVTVP